MPPFDFVLTIALLLFATLGLIATCILYFELREARKQQHRTLVYAQGLARSLHNRHYSLVAPEWEPYDDMIGLLTQIDNMAAGLARVKP